MIGPLEPLFTEGFANHRDSFVLAGDDPSETGINAGFVRGSDLLRGPALRDALNRCARLYPEASHRAVASQWARAWAMALLPVVLGASLVLDHELPIDIEDIAVRFDSDGKPTTFIVPHPGRRIAPTDPFERFDLLVHSHLAPLFASASNDAEVSPRVLFGQTGFLFGWLADVAAGHPLALQNAGHHGRALLEAPRWSDGRPNPLYRPIVTIDLNGETRSCKRVCYLSSELTQSAGPCLMCPAKAKKKGSAACVKQVA